MKEKYVKPEVFSQDFSMQIFLQNCYTANDGGGFVADTGLNPCWETGFGCEPCAFPGQIQNSNMHPHPQ